MLRKISRIIAGLIILSGIALLCYPSFANYINKKFESEAITNYNNQVDSMSDDEIQQELELAQAYNQSLPAAYPADPFTGENVRDFTGTDYENFSMVQQGEMLGYVEIPDIDVYLPIYYGVSEDVLQKGAGLVDNTSLPVGGKGTHAVISAHTGLASKKMFTDLTELKEGDIFFIHVLNMDLAYQVDQIKVVLPEDVEDLLIEKESDLVTLLTCTPFGINDHRLLVRGERIDYDFSKDEDTDWRMPQRDMYFWVMVLGIFLFIIFVLMIVHRTRKKNCKKNDSGKM